MSCFPLHLLKACSIGSSKIKVMTVDGSCLRFAAPIIAKEVLMEYPCHALFLSDSVRTLGERARPLHSTISLEPDNVYFLIPQTTSGSRVQSAAPLETSTAPASSVATSRSTRQRKVSFATSTDSARSPMFEGRHVESADSTASWKKSSVEFLPSPSEGVLRLKMVVSKRQLACVLKEGGDCVSMVEGLLSPLLRELASEAAESSNISCSAISWRPSLQSIPETS